MTEKAEIKSALESMMFVWGQPLEVKIAAEIFGADSRMIDRCFRELQEEYQSRGSGIRIREADGAFQFVTAAENDEYIRRLCTPVKRKRLSQSALEVLAIIAYKQPVTKGEIEEVRGVKCDKVLDGLGKKGLVEEAGRSEGIGRPILYRTTAEFLKNFGFSSLDELPEIEDIAEVINTEE